MDLQVRRRSAANEVDAMPGSTYVNEDLFKVYAQRLFKRSDFEMVFTKRDDLDDLGIGLAKNTYHQFWHKHSGHSFWVKCEFIKDNVNELDWGRPDRLEYHKQFQENVWPEKVYLVIGFGGRPLKPSFMFCIPLDEAEDCNTYPNVFKKYERDPSRPFDLLRGFLV
jgi:hypothetical protein